MSTEIKIVKYDEFEQKLDELKDQANFLPDVTTKEGYDKSKKIHTNLRKVENNIEKIRKDEKKYWLEGSRQVDAQAKALMEKIADFRLPHTEAYQELDKLKKEREQKRQDDLIARVEYIRNLPESMVDASSDEVLLAMEDMKKEECVGFDEFYEQALKARNKTRNELAKIFAYKKKEEAEAEELEQLRKEKAEREQKEREERIAREASAKAEAEKQAALEREKKAELNKIAAEKAAVEAEKRRIEEAEAAKVAAKKAAKLAEDRAIQAAEDARLAEVKRAEDEALRVKQERETREKNTRHIGNIRRQAKEDLIALGITEDQAKKIVLSIHSGGIRNITIKY